MANDTTSTSPTTLFEFRALKTLPYGCVAVGYVAQSLALDVVEVEVKGPHCTVGHHTNGPLLVLDEVSSAAGAVN